MTIPKTRSNSMSFVTPPQSPVQNPRPPPSIKEEHRKAKELGRARTYNDEWLKALNPIDYPSKACRKLDFDNWSFAPEPQCPPGSHSLGHEPNGKLADF